MLDQIAAQRGTFDREFIFVDDGSLEILKARTADWPDTTVIEQANHGVAHATNRGIERARMEFIKLCDADDLLADGATQALLETLRAHPSATLAWGGAEVIEQDHALPNFGTDLSNAPVEVITDPLRLMIRASPFATSQIMVRADAARVVVGCDERLWFSQDFTLALRVALLGNFVRLDATVLYILRNVSGRLSADVRTNAKISAWIAPYQWLIAEHPDLPWRLKRYACRHAVVGAWHRARHYHSTRYRGTVAASQWLRVYLRLRCLFILRPNAAFIERWGAFFDGIPPPSG